MQRIWPYLLYEDSEAAIAWLERAFGFRLKDRQTGSGGGLHAELEVHPDGTTQGHEWSFAQVVQKRQ